MLIDIETASHTPIYLQIVEQMRLLVASGRLEVGARLPSVRGLAERLLVNPNTVARAYRTLEREGVVVGRKGDGMFVADHQSRFRQRDREALLAVRVDRLLDEAAQLGMRPDEVVPVVARRARQRTADEGDTTNKNEAKARGVDERQQ